jgi:hypothetical protein
VRIGNRRSKIFFDPLAKVNRTRGIAARSLPMSIGCRAPGIFAGHNNANERSYLLRFKKTELVSGAQAVMRED